MKPQHTPKTLMTAIVLGMTALGINSAWAQTTQPAQTPLMNAAKGAVPNVMINLDNSGSMAMAFLDTYPARLNFRGNPALFAMRSAVINPMYYDPRKYYAPRLQADGTTVFTPPATNANIGVTAVIGGTDYGCGAGNNFGICSDRSAWAADPNLAFLANWGTAQPIAGQRGFRVFWRGNQLVATGNGSTRSNYGVWSSVMLSTPNGLTGGSRSSFGTYWVPVHREYQGTTAVGNGQLFRYVTGCNAVAACESGRATQRTVVDIFPNGSIQVNNRTSTTVPLPAGSVRPDCGANATTCTWAQENANIIRWYNFYSTRIKAVATAIGQSLTQPRFTDKLRIGYSQMNRAQNNSVSRGVRYWRNTAGNNNQQWKTDMLNWLYTMEAFNGTPAHDAINRVARYYSGNNNGTHGNPWKNDPTSGAAVNTSDLACRRAYHIFLSDGGWNTNNNFPAGASNNQVVTPGGLFTGNPDGNATSFAYNPAGQPDGNGGIDRNRYIPYSGGRGANGLADLTAHYYWNTDFSTLANNVSPIPSVNNPTFWQNMTTYNIGWGLAPGRGNASSFTWANLNNYRRTWLAGNPQMQGIWPTRALTFNGNVQDNINDFVRSGYTGGGKSFSVYSADEVTRAFNEILGTIVSSGNDAGVAVSGNNTGGNENLEDQLRYNVTYETASNSGSIEAYKLEATTNTQGEKKYSVGARAWAATVNPVASRQLYALSGTAGSFSNQTLAANTALSSLPADLTALLNTDGNQSNNSAFIRYILGEEGVADTNGTPYRSRAGDIGASVNSPPIFAGGELNMGYATMGDVEGKGKYQTYLNAKQNGDTTIFAATNEGMVHVLNAATKKDSNNNVIKQGGLEIAAYMPKGAMAHQIDLASTNFRFKYVLDGPLVADDMYDSTNTKWRQVVTGTGGRGGKYAYAIESPFNAGTDRTPNANSFLWDIRSTDSGYADMGYITNLSTSGQLQDGSWVTLMPSGHYAGTGKVGLYVVNALTGQRKYFIQIPASYANNNRGLSGIVAVRDSNREIVAAYAGDANGNVWRFDLRNSAGKTPRLSYGEPLFITDEDDDDKDGKREQPIYAAPAWQVHPGDGGETCPTATRTQCGAIVNVATGILLEDADVTGLDEDNAIYGLWDPTPIGGDDLSASDLAVFRDGKFTIDDDDLYERELEEITVTPTTPNTDSKGNTYYKIKEGVIDWARTKEENGKQVKANRGWELELGEVNVANVGKGGERVIGDLHYAGSALVVPSVFVPNSTSTTVESCNSTGLANMLYVIDAVTGQPTNFFKEYKASAVLLPAGGFTRGLALKKTSGSPIIGKTNEGYPDLKPKKCSPGKFALVGAGGIMQGEVSCVSGWTRTWRTIINSPFSNG